MGGIVSRSVRTSRAVRRRTNLPRLPLSNADLVGRLTQTVDAACRPSDRRRSRSARGVWRGMVSVIRSRFRRSSKILRRLIRQTTSNTDSLSPHAGQGGRGRRATNTFGDKPRRSIGSRAQTAGRTPESGCNPKLRPFYLRCPSSSLVLRRDRRVMTRCVRDVAADIVLVDGHFEPLCPAVFIRVRRPEYNS